MAVRVYKFGGASLADIGKVKAVAEFLKKEKLKHNCKVLAVVSAMGKTTDELIAMAKSVSPHPQRRELDMLITTGERVSMSLMSIALHELGVTAISFTGSQAGIITDTSHGNARIVATKPFRLQEHLENGDTVVLAGFQGVSDSKKEITTLGRGGTDTTAVAMASYFNSEVCEFKKDVGGICTADPKMVPAAKNIPRLTHKNLMDITFWGGKILHYRAAELAHFLGLPLRFSHFQNENEFTLVTKEDTMLEQQKVIAVNSHKDVYEITFKSTNQAQVMSQLHTDLQNKNILYPQILGVISSGQQVQLLCVGEIGEMAKSLSQPCDVKQLSSVTLTCQGSVSSELFFTVNKYLAGTAVHHVLQDTTNLTVFVAPDKRETVIQSLHSLVGA